jgi:hypothetical protein
MDDQTGHLEALLELEARHDDLLHRLAELDKRVEQVLARYTGGHRASTECGQSVTDGPPSVPPVQMP